MKRKRYTKAQIAIALQQAKSGTPVAEVTRKLGITEQIFRLWKKSMVAWALLKYAASNISKKKTRSPNSS